MALSRLVTLSISSLHNLDIDAYKFYDRAHRLYDAAILTRCYTQHALWPYIDSEINHIRLFIKIQFFNKGIEFINLLINLLTFCLLLLPLWESVIVLCFVVRYYMSILVLQPS